MNRVMLIGRLTKDPYVKETPSGAKYARFTLAVNRIFGNNQTDFIPIVAWNQSATFIENYIQKGALVSIDGRFTSSSYQNANNEYVTQYEVVVERIQPLESKNTVRSKNRVQNVEIEEDNTNDLQETNQQIEFLEKEMQEKKEKEENDIPWEMDL